MKTQIHIMEMDWCKRAIINIKGKLSLYIIVDMEKMYPGYKIDFVEVG